MAGAIEDYALLGDSETAALVDRSGSIDWLTLPRFDSGACFTRLLGDDENGFWRIAPKAPVTTVERRYLPGSLVLETVFHTDDGTVAVTDLLTPHDEEPSLVRIVEGRSGRVPMRSELRVRFDYGAVVPWVRRVDGRVTATGGPDTIVLTSPVENHGVDMATVAEFTIAEGDTVPFSITWYPSHHAPPRPLDASAARDDALAWWEEWSQRCTYDGSYAAEARQSLTVLKGLTHAPTGGLVAAPTMSLPEQIGGERNWDYRYCWLRDATFSLMALLLAGYSEEAVAWRDWLLRAVAGDPAKLQIMYGVDGRRRLPEAELPWLDGYEASRPVRIGNAAASQFQLDVYGEVMDALDLGRSAGMPDDHDAWELQKLLLDFLEGNWQEPDEGLWEVRGRRRQFTHSKVMAWVAADRAVRAVERHGMDGPVDTWRRLRSAIRDEVLDRGVDDRGVLVQHYETTELDASLLMAPLVGFLPADDPRVANTAHAVRDELTEDGFVLRYRTDTAADDGLAGGESAFLLCTFWLADNLAMIGEVGEATALYQRLLDLRNDIGLLSEEYDPHAKRMLGNFPQAFSHVALVNTAMNLCDRTIGPAERRSDRDQLG